MFSIGLVKRLSLIVLFVLGVMSFSGCSAKESISTSRYLNLNNGMMLSDALQELSRIEDRVYFLSSDDIHIPSLKSTNDYKIDSFYKLNDFLKDTTNYKIIVEKNKLFNNKPKIIKVAKMSKQELPFLARGNMVSDNTDVAIAETSEALTATPKKAEALKIIGFTDLEKLLEYALVNLDNFTIKEKRQLKEQIIYLSSNIKQLDIYFVSQIKTNKEDLKELRNSLKDIYGK